MMHWSQELATDIEELDAPRRALVEALADFMIDMDRSELEAKRLQADAGRIYLAMKTLFAREAAMLGARGADHVARHDGILKAYVGLCQKGLQRVRSSAEAHQACIAIFQMLSSSLLPHLKAEVAEYRRRPRAA